MDIKNVNIKNTNGQTALYIQQMNTEKVMQMYGSNTDGLTLLQGGRLGVNNQYTSGVTNNGAYQGTVIFTVPQDAPDTLYYSNSTEFNMQGQLNIVDYLAKVK